MKVPNKYLINKNGAFLDSGPVGEMTNLFNGLKFKAEHHIDLNPGDLYELFSVTEKHTKTETKEILTFIVSFTVKTKEEDAKETLTSVVDTILYMIKRHEELFSFVGTEINHEKGVEKVEMIQRFFERSTREKESYDVLRTVNKKIQNFLRSDAPHSTMTDVEGVINVMNNHIKTRQDYLLRAPWDQNCTSAVVNLSKIFSCNGMVEAINELKSLVESLEKVK